MSFSIPSLSDLVERSRSAFRTYLAGTDAWIWPNNINPTAKVLGGAMYELHQRLAYVERQKFASTAEGEWLDRHGFEIGLSRNPAAKATGTVTFTSTGAFTVAPGAVLARTDGVQFATTLGGQLLIAGTLSLPVVAVVAGKAGITPSGTPLSIVSNVVGSATVAVDASGLVGGADDEDDEAFRARILFRKRFPPHGGSAPDYVEWATEVPGVTRVYVERTWNGAGTVRVFPITDGATSNGIPSGPMVAAVKSYLEARAPAGAVLTVAAPVAQQIDMIVSGLSPSSVEVREAVKAEVADTFRRLGRVAGNDSEHPAMPFLATPATFSLSWIWQAIANATGEQRHKLIIPNDDTVVASGSMPVPGSITFI